jgi:GGDEF domain-containing protein
VALLLIAVMSLGMLSLTELARVQSGLEAHRRGAHPQVVTRNTRELERMATHDPLTGLYNRRYADDYLDAAN